MSAERHPGGPWEQQERHVRVWKQIFNDFVMSVGPESESCLRSVTFCVFSGLLPGHLLHRFVNGIPDSWGS